MRLHHALTRLFLPAVAEELEDLRFAKLQLTDALTSMADHCHKLRKALMLANAELTHLRTANMVLERMRQDGTTEGAAAQ